MILQVCTGTNRGGLAGQGMAQSVSDRFSDLRFVNLVTAFGLGFIAAAVLFEPAMKGKSLAHRRASKAWE